MSMFIFLGLGLDPPSYQQSSASPNNMYDAAGNTTAGLISDAAFAFSEKSIRMAFLRY